MPSPTIIHAITPGDHFSPLTGSAIPTVVHGMASAAIAAGDLRQCVVIDRSTYRQRYGSADVAEYEGAAAPSGIARRLDVLRGALGGARPAVESFYGPLADSIRRLPPGIVLAHNAPVLVRLLRGTDHSVVLYAHNELLRTYSRTEAGRMLDGVAAIICVSDSLARATRARLPRQLADRIHVVHNGADTLRFAPSKASAPAPDEPHHAPRGTVRVMFVGRVIPEKGVDVLIRAATQMSSDQVEFLIVGSAGFARDAPLSDYERRLRQLAGQGVANIRFEPFVERDSLPALLADADVFVIPSRWPDPCPLTVGEALAAGLPIVASRIGGIAEIAAPSSRLVPPDDPTALAREIGFLATNARLRQLMATDARAWAESHDWAWAWKNLKLALARAGCVRA